MVQKSNSIENAFPKYRISFTSHQYIKSLEANIFSVSMSISCSSSQEEKSYAFGKSASSERSCGNSVTDGNSRVALLKGIIENTSDWIGKRSDIFTDLMETLPIYYSIVYLTDLFYTQKISHPQWNSLNSRKCKNSLIHGFREGFFWKSKRIYSTDNILKKIIVLLPLIYLNHIYSYRVTIITNLVFKYNY